LGVHCWRDATKTYEAFPELRFILSQQSVVPDVILTFKKLSNIKTQYHKKKEKRSLLSFSVQ